jgi:hypothetical protein
MKPRSPAQPQGSSCGRSGLVTGHRGQGSRQIAAEERRILGRPVAQRKCASPHMAEGDSSRERLRGRLLRNLNFHPRAGEIPWVGSPPQGMLHRRLHPIAGINRGSGVRRRQMPDGSDGSVRRHRQPAPPAECWLIEAFPSV